MLKEKVITVYGSKGAMDYTEEDYIERFKFVERPNFQRIREIYLHSNWIDMVMENDKNRIFNDVHGTLVEQ